MARRRDPELCERWAERIQRQKSSGLTIARFCEHEAVSQVSFHAWKGGFRATHTLRADFEPPIHCGNDLVPRTS